MKDRRAGCVRPSRRATIAPAPMRMRAFTLTTTAAVAATALVGGCNWVYGIDTPLAQDGPGPTITKSSVQWVVIAPDGTSTAMAQTLVPFGSEAARPDMPMLQISAMPGPSDVTAPSLQAVSYHSADGSFDVPLELLTTPLRVVFTAPGDPLVHEVQSPIGHVDIALARSMRANAQSYVQNSGYNIETTRTGGATNPLIVFSSAFGVGAAYGSAKQGELVFSTQAVGALAGPPGFTLASAQDWLLALDFPAFGGEVSAVGWAFVPALQELVPAMTTTLSPVTWYPTLPPRAVAVAVSGNEPASSGLSALASATTGICACTPAWMANYGFLPSQAAFGFARAVSTVADAIADERNFMMLDAGQPYGAPGVTPDGTYGVERPLILPVEMLPLGASQPMTLHVGETAASISGFPIGLQRVVRLGATSKRTAGGVPLYATMQMISAEAQQATTFPATIAGQAVLSSGSTQYRLDVADGMPCVRVASTLFELQWLDFGSAIAGADDYSVTLYEVSHQTIGTNTVASLIPEREYTVTAKRVVIDPNDMFADPLGSTSAILTDGGTYVFGITTHAGYAATAQGDFRTVRGLPFGSSTMFPSMFNYKSNCM